MGLNYDRDHQTRGKSEKERILLSVGKFPECKGLYPDNKEYTRLLNREMYRRTNK